MQAAAWLLLVFLFHVRHVAMAFSTSPTSASTASSPTSSPRAEPVPDVAVEYPPLSLPLMVLPTRLAWLGGYDWVFAVEMMVFSTAAAVVTVLAAAAAVAALARAPRRRHRLHGGGAAGRPDRRQPLRRRGGPGHGALRLLPGAPVVVARGGGARPGLRPQADPGRVLAPGLPARRPRRAVVHSAVAFAVAAALPSCPTSRAARAGCSRCSRTTAAGPCRSRACSPRGTCSRLPWAGAG